MERARANRIRRLRKNNKIEFHAHRAGGGGAHLNLVTGRVFVRRECIKSSRGLQCNNSRKLLGISSWELYSGPPPTPQRSPVNNLRCAFSSEGARINPLGGSARAQPKKRPGLLFQTVLTKLSELWTICMRSTFAHIIRRRSAHRHKISSGEIKSSRQINLLQLDSPQVRHFGRPGSESQNQISNPNFKL